MRKTSAVIRFINRRIILKSCYFLSRIFHDMKNDRVILCYHGIGETGNGYSVTLENFEKQMKKIAESVRFVSLDDLLNFTHLKNSGPLVSLTFDDGYADFMTVLPILKRLKIPATLFVLSHPDRANRTELAHDGALLSYKQLRKLHSSGIGIGCHSATHADFHVLSKKQRIQEIQTAKKTLEKKLGSPVSYFAYPKGRYTSPNVTIAKKAGFKAAFTTEHQLLSENASTFTLPRVIIDGSYTAQDFPYVISWTTFLIQKLHRRLAYNRFLLFFISLFRVYDTELSQRTTVGKKEKVTISIATSAYNEEKNIRKCLKSVQAQRGENIFINEILVVSDGSTDSTVEKVKQFSDSRIKLFAYKERLGKSARLNHIFRCFSGDILVILDGDGYLPSKHTIEHLVHPMQHNKNIGLVAGRMNPVHPLTTIEKAVVNYYKAHYEAVKLFDYNKSAYGCHGLLAYRRSFAKRLTIPADCVVDDAYSYFSCLAEGFTYAFAYDAVIRYRCPQSVKDYLSQSLRYYAGGEQLFGYFAKEDVIKGYSLPRNVLFKTLLLQLQNDMTGYFYLKIMHAYVLYKTRIKHLNIDSQWTVIQSSKVL